jgi:hypothetical protein
MKQLRGFIGKGSGQQMLDALIVEAEEQIADMKRRIMQSQARPYSVRDSCAPNKSAWRTGIASPRGRTHRVLSADQWRNAQPEQPSPVPEM